MTEEQETRVDLLIRNMADVITARRRGLEMALEMGFVRPDATKIAVVISELTRNIINYAERGTVTLTISHQDRPHFEIIARDRGPGITDVKRVLAGGYSSGRGLGKGLSGSRQMMDEFKLQSTVGFGTTVTARKYLPG